MLPPESLYASYSTEVYAPLSKQDLEVLIDTAWNKFESANIFSNDEIQQLTEEYVRNAI